MTSAETSTFIGRRGEVSAARRLLARGRLLTLTGAGGVGKTRLAVRVAEALRPAYDDGVEIVELASLEDPDLLVPTVATALGVRDAGPSPMSVLVDYLAERHVLLVLDNCEHLLDACARLVDGLLRGAGRLRVLATSRQTLGVAGEQVLVVPSLSVPDPAASPRDIARSESVRMLADRVARVRPGFTLERADVRVFARLCRRLDGIPLAIELAAGRLASTPAEELERRLDERFEILDTGAGGDGPPRHQTMRAAVDWSFDLCTRAEQRLWCRLSMFAGGVEVETAEEVCAGDGIEPEDVFELLAGLVDKSILVAESHEAGVRYHMLESIRSYGREKLVACGEEEALRRRFCDHYRRLVAERRVDRLVPEQLARYRVLAAELPNIRVALDLSYARPQDAADALDTASAMWGYWILAGSVSEGRHWMDRGLALVPRDARARRAGLWTSAMLALLQGDRAPAETMLEEAQRLARESGDDETRAFATQVSAMVAFTAGDARNGMALMEKARAAHVDRGDLSALGINLYYDAAYSAEEDPERAGELAQEFLTLCEKRRAEPSRGYALFAVGVTTWHQGHPERAEAMLKEAMAIRRTINDRWGLAECVEVLAWIAGAYGRHERAARMLGVANALWQAMGTSPTTLRPHMRDHESCVARTREALGPRVYAAAFHSGERLGLDRALPYVIEE
ncbi:ATP-binding protein [Nonomuraea rhodomycinica]|uniref:AAA family ATPase n=1 Tax=Nonomuraea rhodomycinica TaxID=1712872 RepID=A0A7Y6INE4_9ACTN|nr:AAA family ATPase [Nonomuraea rhodomycinica]NUW41151.1 AAA family ATPase [Nonomuraea rhodomycinica]